MTKDPSNRCRSKKQVPQVAMGGHLARRAHEELSELEEYQTYDGTMILGN